MHRRFYANAALLSALALVGGCTQMTRHSNMVVFGTNTVVGVRVGTAATQVPSIDIGYTRQEAVLMPLVANTATTTTTRTNDAGTVTSQSTQLAPCNMSAPVPVVVVDPKPPADAAQVEIVPHPCLLAASNTEEGAKDSYSVLASFGAHFDTSSSPDQQSAKGGLAQYFATGMAAQLLALNGGAAVVAVSEAAKESAKSGKVSLGQTAPAPALNFAAGSGTTFSEKMVDLRSKIRDLPLPADRTQKMRGFLDAFTPAMPGSIRKAILDACGKTEDECVNAVNGAMGNFAAPGSNFSTALDQWSRY